MKIVIKEDKGAEIEIFQKFLHSKEYPQHRNIIYSSFPELELILRNNNVNFDEEKLTIANFLNRQREKHAHNIQKSITYISGEIEKHSEKSLSILAKLMNYSWPKNTPNYILIPTIFPMCPFNGNTFFFSIYKSLGGTTEYPKILSIAVHEISHMIFF